MLEEIDVIFQEISNDMEKRPNMIRDKIGRGELDIPVDATALNQYVAERFGDLPNVRPRYGATGTERILDELNSSGIKTLADLNARVNSKLRNAYQKQGKYSGIDDNITTFVRHILTTNDTKSYFERAWNNHFHTIDPTSLELVRDSGPDTDEILKHLEISTMQEKEAKDQGLRFKIKHEDMSGWASSRQVGETCAAFKVLIEEDTNRILGAHILGPHAEEVINIFSLAIRLGLTAKDLNDPILYAYPTNSSDIIYML